MRRDRGCDYDDKDMLASKILQLLLGLVLTLPCGAQTTYELVTRSISNGYAPGSRPAVSGDGRYVVFRSESTRLVSGFPQNLDVAMHWYLRDLNTGSTELLTRDASGAVGVLLGPLSEHAYAAGVSDDGRFVAFDTSARLLPEDTDDALDVYLRDRTLRTLHLLEGANTNPDIAAGITMISPDGRVVAFTCLLVPKGDDDFRPRICWMDLQTGESRSIGERVDGKPQQSGVLLTDLAMNGRRVVFHSDDDGLVPGDTNNAPDVFVYDVDTDHINRVSLDYVGRQINRGPDHIVAGEAGRLSENGRVLVFESPARGITPEVVAAAGATTRVYARDLLSGETTLLCRYGDSLVGPGLYVNQFGCREPDVSGDGQIVVFRSKSTEMIDGPGSPQVYEANLQTRRLRLLSKDSSGQPCDGFCGPSSNDSLGEGFGYSPRISDDGAHVVFSGAATNLLPVNDVSNRVHLYARSEPRVAPIVARAAPLSPWMYAVLLMLLGGAGMRASSGRVRR